MPHTPPPHETSLLLTPNPIATDFPQKPTRLQRLKRHLATEITPHGTDFIILFCYIITGLLDSSAVSIWGSFVSMQTGNTVYLGLGLSGLDEGGKSQRWLKALISISSFCIGSLIFAALPRVFRSPRERGALVLSFMLQMGCVAVAAGIVSFTTQPQDKADGLGWKNGVPLALVAFQSAGQAVTSRVVGFSGLTSVVLTSVYCDFFSYLGRPGCGKRADEWRRLGAVGGLMLGILLGGVWAKSEVGLMGALWTAVVFKGAIAVAWLCWEGEEGGRPIE
ncbi:hypothetical protein BDW75DRAFT_247110 [Aspergillus navahoensis]